MTADVLQLRPRFERSRVVIPAPAAGAGNWTGGACAVLVDDVFWLAYRSRRPLQEGRGVTTVVARSEDGERFETVCELHREDYGAASFERPALVRHAAGWRLYLSCAEPESKHWWVEAVDADSPEGFTHGQRTLTLPGSPALAVKDPVVSLMDGSVEAWEMWLCCHPLDVPGDEDRMTTHRLTSADGLAWHDHGEVLAGTPGRWDARGTRVTSVIGRDPLTVLYDGRPDAASNWRETTGIASWSESRLQPVGNRDVARSPHADGALRYATAVPLPGGRTRFYFEAARADGAHDLMTCTTG